VTILPLLQNVYGPRLDRLGRRAGLINHLPSGSFLRGEPLTVIGDGTQTRCFTYIDDAPSRATIAAGLGWREGRRTGP